VPSSRLVRRLQTFRNVREVVTRRPARSARRGAEPFIPKTSSLRRLEAAVDDCRGCDLYRHATQGVFGEGPRFASLMLVGEQPGDREDLEGAPFVGPAGALLDRALADARIRRADVFVTNVVKHFKFTHRGKRRIHKRPAAEEIAACRPWLDAELEAVKPRALVCLGATAAQAILGRQFRVTKERGRLIRESDLAPVVMATVHPSSILRAPDERTRHEETRAFVEDLKTLAKGLREDRQARATR
jgi:uracil-DNA glycosylase